MALLLGLNSIADTVVIHISEEGLLPHCPNCLVSSNITNNKEHHHSDTYIRGTIQHHCHIKQYHNELSEQTHIMINNQVVENVDTSKYLGYHISATSNDIQTINQNLKNAKKTWGRNRFLQKRRREGIDKNPNCQLLYYSNSIRFTLHS
jgi:hypothetical protein